MRVDLLHPCYWPEVRRGSERFIHDLGVRLAAAGHSPRLLTSHPGPTTAIVEEGMEVVRLHRPRGARFQPVLRGEFLLHAPATRRQLRAGDAEIAHALYPVDGVLANAWSRRTRRPSVFSLMGMPRPESVARPVWRRVALRAMRGADAAVALSPGAADAAAKLLGVECRVIAPGVDLDAFTPSESRSESPLVLCPSDLTDPRKRGRLLLAGFRLLRARVPGARLLLSEPRGPGSAELRDRLKEEPGVELTRLDSREALVEAYSSAWATVLPSEAEAFGLVLVESLACGTPAVGMSGGGAEEIVGTGGSVGALVERAEPGDLAAAIEAAMQPGEGNRGECRERAELFSADRCAEAYAALYAELLA